MTHDHRCAYIIDADAAERAAIGRILKTVRLKTFEFASSEEFLANFDPDADAVVIPEIRLPGMSGLALLKKLRAMPNPVPVIFVTAHADVATAVEAIRGGAVDFFQKPVEAQRLIDQVHQAFEANRLERERAECRARCKELLSRLTRREHQVLVELVQGLSNRVIAESLNIRERTVEAHRAGIMRKLEAHSIVDVVRCAFAAGIDDPARPISNNGHATTIDHNENTVMRSFA